MPDASPIQQAPTINGRMPRVVIGLPSHDHCFMKFALSLTSLATFSMAHGVHTLVVNHTGCYVDEGRRHCAEQAMKAEADYLFFMDTDMVIPSSAILRLMSHGKPVAAATYVKRVDPHDILMAPWEKTNQLPTSGLVRAKWLPTGCMLIETAVFKRMLVEDPRTPIFHKPTVYPEDQALPGRSVGEDIDFCRRCEKMGIEMWCDMDLSMHTVHLGTYGFTIHEFHGRQHESMAAMPEPPGTVAEAPPAEDPNVLVSPDGLVA